MFVYIYMYIMYVYVCVCELISSYVCNGQAPEHTQDVLQHLVVIGGLETLVLGVHATQYHQRQPRDARPDVDVTAMT